MQHPSFGVHVLHVCTHLYGHEVRLVACEQRAKSGTIEVVQKLEVAGKDHRV